MVLVPNLSALTGGRDQVVDLAGHLLTSLNVYCTIQMTKEHKKTDNPGETDQCVYVTVRTGYNDKELVKRSQRASLRPGTSKRRLA